ncbi:MAG: (d)CMP kinase [Vulcanimicrobiota bacterium]
MRKANVAIDGFAGSGKTTVAVELARQLELVYLDTGLMYRSVALECLRQGLDASQEQVLADLMSRLDLQVDVVARPHPMCRMILNAQDVTDELHDPRVNALVPRVASCSAVRRELVARQQAFARRGGVVMVGRDIASVVLPEAEVKIFLAADLSERARRRALELTAKGKHMTQPEVEAELSERDRIDSERADSPLICVAEARQLDTTGRTVQEIVDEIAGMVRCGSI